MRWFRYREPRETTAISSYQSLIRGTNSRLDAPVAASGAPFPVILFNHGWHGRRTNDTFLTEELASRGYVVASIDHTYNASLVAFPERTGGLCIPMLLRTSTFLNWRHSGTTESDLGQRIVEASRRPALCIESDRVDEQGCRYAWFGRINANQAGAIGHSFVGAAATEVCAQDPRVHAAVNLDGWFFGAIHARGPGQPLLFVDSSSALPDPPPYLKVSVSAVLNSELTLPIQRHPCTDLAGICSRSTEHLTWTSPISL